MGESHHERLLLGARAADRGLWDAWFPGMGFTYRPPNGILLVQYDTSDVFKSHWDEIREVISNNKLPIRNGACLLMPTGKRVAYFRGEEADGGHVVCPAVVYDGKFHAGPALWIKFSSDGTYIVESFRKYDPQIPHGVVEDISGCLMRFVGAVVMAKREVRNFSLARRPAIAKSGWRGISYEIADLSRMERPVAAVPFGGTHATPVFHWVLGHFRTLKSGKQIWIDPHHRGDPTKGAVIKDWVRKLGLETT